MLTSNPKKDHRRTRTTVRGGLVIGLTTALIALGSGAATAAAVAVPLGDAQPFAVLAGAGVTATGTNVLNGDLGTFPTASITGPGTITVNGTNHGNDTVAAAAQASSTAAYLDAASQGPTQPIAAGLDGLILIPDVYNHGSQLLLSGGELILDAQGDANAVWVFQSGGDLIVDSGSIITLRNGAQACNVFWQVTSSAALSTDAQFVGTILALTSITVATDTTVVGRLLAQNGTVTLDSNTVTVPGCAVAPVGGIEAGDGSSAAPATGAGFDSAVVWSLGALGIVATSVAVVAVRNRRTTVA